MSHALHLRVGIEQSGGSPNNAGMGQDLTRGVILHVEDEESQRESLATLLAVESFEVHQAADSAAVPSLARKLGDRLDVLIVDYHLGGSGPGGSRTGGSGTDVAEGLSALLGYAVPTIMLTGDVANCEVPILSYAPVWVARKPLDPRVLLAGLPALVEFRRGVARVSAADRASGDEPLRGDQQGLDVRD